MLRAGGPAGAAASSSMSRNVRDTRQTARALDAFIERVSEYTIQLLCGEAPDRLDAHTNSSKAITPGIYMSLLPTVWALISSPEATFTEQVLQACIEHATKASSTSSVKRHTVDFIGRLLLVGRMLRRCLVLELTIQ